MRRFCEILSSCVLLFLMVGVPFEVEAYAVGTSSISSLDSSSVEEVDPQFIIQCAHLGTTSFFRPGPGRVEVTVTNNVTEAFFIPCTDIMEYTLFYEILYPNGDNYGSGTRKGRLGSNLFEKQSFGGVSGFTFRCRLVTTVHLQTRVYDWKETIFL